MGENKRFNFDMLKARADFRLILSHYGLTPIGKSAKRSRSRSNHPLASPIRRLGPERQRPLILAQLAHRRVGEALGPRFVALEPGKAGAHGWLAAQTAHGGKQQRIELLARGGSPYSGIAPPLGRQSQPITAPNARMKLLWLGRGGWISGR